MNVGDTVYLRWYDFRTGAENVYTGTVVDNSLWEGTRWQDYVNVQFQPVGMKAPICHHFLPEKLSTANDNVPHDGCYLVCAKRKDTTDRSNPSDVWQRVQQFKQEHWDEAHGHLATDALDEYYQMWRDAISAKRGYVHIYEVALFPAVASSPTEPTTPTTPTPPKRKKKQQQTNVIQLSLF